MNKYLIFFIIFFSFFPTVSFSITDYDYENLINSSSEFKDIDRRLNEAFKDTMSKLNMSQKEQLKKNQIKWIKTERDIEANKYISEDGLNKERAYIKVSENRINFLNNYITNNLDNKVKEIKESTRKSLSEFDKIFESSDKKSTKIASKNSEAKEIKYNNSNKNKKVENKQKVIGVVRGITEFYNGKGRKFEVNNKDMHKELEFFGYDIDDNELKCITNSFVNKEFVEIEFIGDDYGRINGNYIKCKPVTVQLDCREFKFSNINSYDGEHTSVRFNLPYYFKVKNVFINDNITIQNYLEVNDIIKESFPCYLQNNIEDSLTISNLPIKPEYFPGFLKSVTIETEKDGRCIINFKQ